MRKPTLLLAALAIAVLLAAVPGQADTTFVVDRPDDVATATACAEAANDCSLRGAIIAANTTSGANTITVPEGTYSLTIANAGEDLVNPLYGADATAGDLDIIDALTINGAGANSTTVAASSGYNDRIFSNHSGVSSTISGLTITGGSTEHSGGGILNIGGGNLTVSSSTITNNNTDGHAGAIYNYSGTLAVQRSSITNNTGFADGGAIYTYLGTVSVERSTISGNSAGRWGGGVYSFTDDDFTTSKVTITNSTISGNSANEGGGVYNARGAARIENSTITDNTAESRFGSGVASDSGRRSPARTEVSSSIIAANTNTDVDFVGGTINTFVSEGYNLIGNGRAKDAFNQSGDQIGVSRPGLKPLALNAPGSTPTHALKPTSPAINAIPSATNGCATTIATDQRGVERPQGGNCEIGSFEDISPKVTRVVPEEDATGVGRQPTISAFFSEAMQRAIINTTTFKLFKVEGTTTTAIDGVGVEYKALAKKAILTPNAPLELGATYKAVITTGAQDLAGNSLDQNQNPSDGNQRKVWFFTVRT